MKQKILSGMISRMVRPMVFIDQVVRQFLTLGGVNEFGNASVYTAVDGDVIEFDFASTATTDQTVFDELAGANRLFATLGTTGTSFTVPAGVTVDIDGGGNTVVSDGKLHHVKLTIGAAAVGLKIDIYGKKFDATEFFDGVLPNIRFTGSDNRFYRMNQGRFGLGAYETDALATLGAELFDDSLTAGGGGTIDTVDGVTTVTNGVGGFDYAYNTNAFVTEAGKTYIIELQALGGTSIGAVTFGAGTAVGGIELGAAGVTGVGPQSFVFTAVDTTSYFRAGPNNPATGVTFIFSGLTVREAPNAMLLSGLEAIDWEQFTQVGADWLGSTNRSTFTTPIVCDGTEGTFELKAIGTGTATVGETYQVDVTADITQGIMYMENFDGVVYDLVATPSFISAVSTSPNPRVQTRGTVPTVGTITDISFLRILRAP